MIFARIALVAGLLFAFAPIATAVQAAPEKTLENTVLLDLKDGRVTILLRPDLAPKHVERIKTLTREGFYDGIVFHRVLDGFMAQTGDPTGTGMGGSDYPDVEAEFSSEPFERGVVGAARSQDPNSANSQFFIMFDAAPSLNNQYTVWGEVVDGMEHVDAIKRGAPPSGTVENPDKIVKMQIAADADAASQEKAKQALQNQ
jgi:peptidylprolyl isomerase